MILGKKDDFAIECIHESDYPNEHGLVYGRMCVWCCGIVLGRIDEPQCVLNENESHFLNLIGRIDDLRDEAVDRLTDEAAFQFLDAALYLDDDRTDEQVSEDSKRFRKFDFLTNEGESFNGIKAFLLRTESAFRILYRTRRNILGSGEVTRDGLVGTILAFLEWMTTEKQNVSFAE